MDLTWYGNRERDKRNGFTIPPNYSVRQVVDALARPAWTWDLLTHDVYSYANIDADVPAEALADFINAQMARRRVRDRARGARGQLLRRRRQTSRGTTRPGSSPSGADAFPTAKSR